MSVRRRDKAADPFLLTRSAFDLLSPAEKRTAEMMVRDGLVAIVDKLPTNYLHTLAGAVEA